MSERGAIKLSASIKILFLVSLRPSLFRNAWMNCLGNTRMFRAVSVALADLRRGAVFRLVLQLVGLLAAMRAHDGLLLIDKAR